MTHTTWRAGSSISEGLRTLRDGGWLTATLVLIVTAVTAVTISVDLITVSGILAAERAYLDAGGDVIVAEGQPTNATITALQPHTSGGLQVGTGALDAARCAALTDLPGVRAAAAVSVLPGTGLAGRPEATLTIGAATRGITDILDLADPNLQVITTPTLAERWGWGPGTWIEPVDPPQPLPDGTLRLDAITPLDRLGQEWDTTVVIPRTAAGPADQCYLRIHPQYRDTLQATLPARLGESPALRIVVRDIIPTGPYSLDPSADFTSRVTRHAGLAGGALAGAILSLVMILRRGRAALYASVGVGYPDGVLIRWTEYLLPLIAGLAWGTGWALALATTTGTPLAVATGLGLRQAATVLATGAIIVVLTGLARPTTMTALKDR